MTRGLWIRNLLIKTINHQISIKDAISVSIARFKAKPFHLMAFGLEFSNVDHILWSIIIDVFINEVYTPRGFEINPEDTIIDIGAHQGVFSAYAAQRTHGKILSFEPSIQNFSKLQALININQINNIEPHQFAVAADSGNRILNLAGTSSTHSLASSDMEIKSEDQNHEIVQTRSLNQILEGIDKVDFLKLDCEGAELEILLAVDGESFNKIKKITAEIHYSLNDPDMKILIQKLSLHYSDIKIFNFESKNLGYMYAKRND